jgi:phosphatidyl-myo-inositol dimannoside synthase
MPMTEVLLLAPSRGLGGGIERYVDTIEMALHTAGVRHTRLDLHEGARKGTFNAHKGIYWAMRSHLSSSKVPTRLVLAHVNLLPVALAASRHREVTGITVVLHGTEIWSSRHRRAIQRLLTRSVVRTVAVSGFSAGALYPLTCATVLRPGLSRGWFDLLSAAGEKPREQHDGLRIATSFRLNDWESKGLPELVEAIRRTGRTDIQLTVCGSGTVTGELRRLIDSAQFCSLRANLPDAELAEQFAAADLFVLATRLQKSPFPSGEGFGLVLMEAQLAGTPVIGPAFGGSSDAFRPGITGASPVDHSADALTRVISDLTSDRFRLASMGESAAAWAREEFNPDRYAALACSRLL